MNRQPANRNFVYVTLADFILRAGYQMGKTPLLPIFAASLGASDALLGFIVSVSTLTGMALKPLIGVLSDRWGRRWWLIAGTLWFAAMPFLYHFVQSPGQLVGLRIVHGLATAIYGPVTLAYIAEVSGKRKAERLGWFDMARSGGYIVGPAAAGWMLLWLAPAQVFTAIGLLSLVALAPVLALSEPAPVNTRRSLPVHRQIALALKAGSRTPAVWLSGGLEATVYLALYALKAFLPIYALAAGVNVAVVGLFFSLQEGTALALKPLGGRMGDRLGYLAAIALGMGVSGAALWLLPGAEGNLALLALA
ncbi:MAG TPA: MFS transporter, partial [Caldilineaceae bacterium]|nr:MFS transporter [Caldilineaceae bacterium]